MQRIGHISSWLLVVLAVLVCQDAGAQLVNPEPCRPVGYVAGELIVRFEPGTSLDRVEDAAEFGVGVKRLIDDFFYGPVALYCVPLGEESTLITMLEALVEVRYATRYAKRFPPSIPLCVCCPCAFDCEIPGHVIPPCDPECVPDADADSFADSCDACTDTDDDGFSDPDFVASFTCPADNCPDTPNPEQADLDADGIGDACDRKLTICHNPPGYPARARTYDVSVHAGSAHLAHGDVPGECVSGPTVLALVPSASTYGIGESVVLQMYVSGATNVDAISFSLRHDPAVVQYVGAIEGTFMNSDGRQTVFLTAPTAGNEIEVALSRRGGGRGAAGTGLLATVEFLAVGVGDAEFPFTGASVEDPQGRFLPAAFNSVTVFVVP